MKFTNESGVIDPSERGKVSYRTGNYYSFNRPSKYLFVWSRLFQSVISQAGTYLLTGKFHKDQAAIYKSEGGCNIPGVGELVLSRSSCYFDSYRRDDKINTQMEKMAKLISYIILLWDPNKPGDSMIDLASEFIGVKSVSLRLALEGASSSANPFGGNALADFFNWNPFSDTPIDREYEKWCRVTFGGETSQHVDQSYYDIDLGREYRTKINQHIRKADSHCWTNAMSCSPRRSKEGKLSFWINTGRQTQIDGWKTEKEIQDFLKSDGKIIDTAKY